MNQDFINWLNSADNDMNNDTNTSQDNDLLVAPIGIADSQNSISEVITQDAPEEINNALFSDSDSDSDSNSDSDSDTEYEYESEAGSGEDAHETQNLQLEFNFDSDSDSESESKLAQENANPKPESEIGNILQELRNLRKQVENLDGNIPAQYDEPPPGTWAEYNTEIDENSELYEHYEQGIDFQEYNDKIPHGTNFTRRLQRILHERKERAAEEKQREESQKTPHPYMIKGVLFCLALIAALLFACGVLFFLQRKIPSYTDTKQQTLILDEQEHKQEPEIAKAGENAKTEAESESHETKTAQTTQPEKPKEVRRPAKPLTFEEYLREGNEAFNLGIYNSALKNFFRALELDDNDSRPYIGLAGAYRAKGLYFDSKRILDEAMIIFRKNPTIETALKILEGESKHGSCRKRNCSK